MRYTGRFVVAGHSYFRPCSLLGPPSLSSSPSTLAWTPALATTMLPMRATSSAHIPTCLRPISANSGSRQPSYLRPLAWCYLSYCGRGGLAMARERSNPRFDPTRSGGLRPPTRAGQPQRSAARGEMQRNTLRSLFIWIQANLSASNTKGETQ